MPLGLREARQECPGRVRGGLRRSRFGRNIPGFWA